jgi:hypothetical protein
MARYDPDVLVCQLNPDHVRVPSRVPARVAPGSHATGVRVAPGPRVAGVDVVEVEDGYGIAAVRVGRGDHTCAARFDPPLPDLRALPAPTRWRGSILLQADRVTELQARYELTRAVDRIDLVIDGFGPWRTRTRRPLLAVLFRLPVFRRWPTTYRWQATLDLAATSEERLTSRWSRDAHGEPG